jgi:hypothetical protein
MACLTENKAKFCEILITTLVFESKANFLPKIAENCDHNIDPWFFWWSGFKLKLIFPECPPFSR